MTDLSVGLVGCGWVAQDRYLPVLDRLEGVNIAGVVDRNLERASAAAGRYGAAAFEDLQNLLDLDLDVLFVCTSPFSHADISQQALEHGLHVLVEKPMAIKVEDAQRMVASAKTHGRHLGVSHNLLRSRSVVAALRQIESGRLGEVTHLMAFQASSPSRRLPNWYQDLPGGLFFDEAPHMIYLLEQFGGGLTLSHASAIEDKGSGTLSSLRAYFNATSGVDADLKMVFDAPVSEWHLTIFCEAGVVVVDLFRDIEFVIRPDRGHRPLDILRTSLSWTAGHWLGTLNTGGRYIARRQFWGHDVTIENFLSSVRTGSQPAVTGPDGLRVVQLLNQIVAEL